MAILAVFTCLLRDRSTWAKTLLLNSNRVCDFTKDQQSPLTKTNLYYRLADQERGGTVEFQLNHSMNTTATRLMEDETNRVLKVNVLSYQIGIAREKNTTENTKIWELCVDNIVYAYDLANGTQCYCYINRGLNLVRLKLSHTVTDLSTAFSTSASLSAS